MARDIFGNKKTTREDRHTRKSTKYLESDIRREKIKIVLMILLGVLYIYFVIQPQSW